MSAKFLPFSIQVRWLGLALAVGATALGFAGR